MRSRYEPSAKFRTYLYAIALKILRAYRRKAAFRATFLGTPTEHAEPAAESGVVTQLLMREALRSLDAMDREILLLREFEQLSYAEIAELLNLPVNTVRSRLFRARIALRELLSKCSVQQPRNAQTRGGHMIHAATHPLTAEELMAFCDGESLTKNRRPRRRTLPSAGNARRRCGNSARPRRRSGSGVRRRFRSVSNEPLKNSCRVRIKGAGAGLERSLRPCRQATLETLGTWRSSAVAAVMLIAVIGISVAHNQLQQGLSRARLLQR